MSFKTTEMIGVDMNNDAYWIQLALRNLADTYCKEHDLPCSAEHCRKLAATFDAMHTTYTKGFVVHLECVEAIEDAAGFDRYTLPRL